MKGYIMTIIGIVGSFIASLFGGWDAGLATLLIFMGIDYVSGLVVAGVFHKSNKTESGALESKAGWKGLCRKCMTLLFVLIAYRLDLAIGVDYIRNAVIIGFMANELISNTSNKVGRRTLAVNGKYIRGFGVPAYTTQSASTPAPSTTKKDITTIAKEVLAGQWGNGDDRKNRLTSAGYDYATVQAKVNELVSGKTSTPTKSVAEVAKEVLAGKWGNGTARKTALENAGYNYSEVQQKVNELCGQKSVTEVAKEVIQGKWGNGATRKSKLEQAGYNYSAVQAEVNRLLR